MGLNKAGGGEGGDEHTIANILVKRFFHTLSLTLLTLLLPLSFLLLARTTSPSSNPPPSSAPISIFLHSNTLLLSFLIAFLSTTSLLHSLTGHHLPKLPAIVSWAFLCTFQACITLGIEASIIAGVEPHNPTKTPHALLIERAVFFVGLYGTMLVWGRMFVRPVVDETVFGARVIEQGVDKAATAAAFGVLWVWLLRDEVELMVLAAGVGGSGNGMVGWNGFVVWLVSYSTVVTGMVRAVEALAWVGKVLYLFLCCRGEVDGVSVCSDPEVARVQIMAE